MIDNKQVLDYIDNYEHLNNHEKSELTYKVNVDIKPCYIDLEIGYVRTAIYNIYKNLDLSTY